MARLNISNVLPQMLVSFLLGFISITFLILVTGGVIFSNSYQSDTNEIDNKQITLKEYKDPNFRLMYPENYELTKDKILATQGIVIDQKNTIHLISPPLNTKNENLSIIFTLKPYAKYLEEDVNSSTCPELFEKKLEPVKAGRNTFTTSGMVFCGPTQASFFYILNGDFIYEAKVETLADYEKEALPEVLRILGGIEFMN
jgi:hypothetical protein